LEIVTIMDLAITGILIEILEELKKLNQKLDLDREGSKADVKGNGIDNEGEILRRGS
jgi:hypothetical protein